VSDEEFMSIIFHICDPLAQNQSKVTLLANYYTSHTTNIKVGGLDSLLTVAKKRKLRWFGHVTRAKGTLANILQGIVEGNRKRGRPKRIWMDNVKDWTGRKTGDLIRLAEERTTWCHIVNSVGSPQWPHGCGT
jgi:hypothetical protein